MKEKMKKLNFLTNLVNTLDKRINALSQLGKLLESLCKSKKDSSYDFWIKKFEFDKYKIIFVTI